MDLMIDREFVNAGRKRFGATPLVSICFQQDLSQFELILIVRKRRKAFCSLVSTKTAKRCVISINFSGLEL